MNVGFSTILTLKYALEYSVKSDYTFVIGLNGIVLK
jgi:hypothetical protein